MNSFIALTPEEKASLNKDLATNHTDSTYSLITMIGRVRVRTGCSLVDAKRSVEFYFATEADMYSESQRTHRALCRIEFARLFVMWATEGVSSPSMNSRLEFLFRPLNQEFRQDIGML
jgi:hypothetical protein